jgi:Rod binding domain-containing protein
MEALLSASQSPQDLLQFRAGVDKPTDHQAALLFEGLVLTQMFQTMRKTIQPSGLFGNDSQTRSTYEYLLDQAVVEHAMASGKGLGLAEKLEKTWEQEKKKASTLS